MSDSKIKYSIIIPVYNSTNSLPELVKRIGDVFSAYINEPYEIIMVDDGSPNPKTWDILEELSASSSIKAIQLMRNFGKPGALLCGIEEAQGQYIITMDDDLQNEPESIPALLAQKEHDVVIGSSVKKKHSISVIITSRIARWFDNIIIGLPKNITNSPLKLFKKEIGKSMLKISTPYPYIMALILYITSDIVSIEVEHAERKYGKSNYNLKRRLDLFFRLLINNSSLLLKLVAMIGFIMFFLSSIYSIYLIFKRLYDNVYVSGWTSIMVVVLITSGLILFSLGVVGEYLIRIINGTENRPPYIVRKKL